MQIRYKSGHSGLLGEGTRISDTLVHRYTPVGVKCERVGRLHRHSSTEDNAMSFSKPDTILKVAYLNKPSVDPVANRTKAVAVVTNTEATKSQHRSLLNIDQTDSTSDDVPQRLTTKEVLEMLPEARPKLSTLPTPIPLELQELIRKQMKEKEQAQTEQEQKITNTRSHCNSEVDDDPNEHGTETHREKSKVENSAKYERRRRQCHKSYKTSHHGQHSRSRYRHNRPSQERRRDTDRYRDRRSSLDRLDGRKPCYEPQQRKRHSPSVVRYRYRGRGRPRRSRSHTNSYDVGKSWYRSRCADNGVRDRHRSHEPPKRNTAPDNASPSSVMPKKGVGVCNLPTGVDSILLPQTTSISTASVASPNTVRTTVTATDSNFTIDIDNDLNIESVETEHADNDARAPRELTSVHVDEIKSQETEPVKLGTPKRKTIDDTDTQTSVVTTASSEHTVTDVSSSDSVSEKKRC